jgi:hypothetical protein
MMREVEVIQMVKKRKRGMEKGSERGPLTRGCHGIYMTLIRFLKL